MAKNRAQDQADKETPETNGFSAADKAVADKYKAAQGDDPENNYVPKDKKEFEHFHVRLEKTQFDSKTGKRLSKPFIQKYTAEAWEVSEKGLPALGYEYKVVWDPTKL